MSAADLPPPAIIETVPARPAISQSQGWTVRQLQNGGHKIELAQVLARPNTTVQPPRPGLGLVFEDTFEHAPDERERMWSTSFFWGGRSLPTNKEEEYYIDNKYRPPSGQPLDAKPFVVRNGVLAIRAEQVPENRRSDVAGYRYTSGLITSYNAYYFRYGYVEVRAKMPKGKGLWPAIWLIRRDIGRAGELDIAEVMGDRPNVLNSTVHYRDGDEQKLEKVVRRPGPDLSADFHTYAVDWTEKTIIFLLDGVEVGRTKTPDALKSPMYLLMNLAVGGRWPGSPDASTVFPAEFLIDYVRVWQPAKTGENTQ